MNFIKKFFKKDYTPKITVEKVQHIFQYGKLNNMTETKSCIKVGRYKLGDLIDWQSEGEFFNGYKDIDIPAQEVPPHIKWSAYPVFAYVSIVDNKVRYHYGENGEKKVFMCPETTKISEIKLIDEIFETYYKKFDLPKSLKATKPAKQTIDKSDKMKFLAEYLASSDADFFNDNFCGDDIYDIVMWVDWKEEDEDIVWNCENIIKTGQLSAEVLDAENERGFDFVITCKNSKTNVPYKGKGADRDTTIRTLNAVIQPDYEIRFCKESDGSDTLAFLPLSREQWKELDAKFTNEIDSKFKRITNETQMFG